MRVPTLKMNLPNSLRRRDTTEYEQRPERKADERFYHSPHWKALRAIQLQRQPFCEICGRPATIAHHATERKQDPEQAASLDNLQSYCASCHSRHHRRSRATDVQQDKTARRPRGANELFNDRQTPLPEVSIYRPQNPEKMRPS